MRVKRTYWRVVGRLGNEHRTRTYCRVPDKHAAEANADVAYLAGFTVTGITHETVSEEVRDAPAVAESKEACGGIEDCEDGVALAV